MVLNGRNLHRRIAVNKIKLVLLKIRDENKSISDEQEFIKQISSNFLVSESTAKQYLNSARWELADRSPQDIKIQKTFDDI